MLYQHRIGCNNTTVALSLSLWRLLHMSVVALSSICWYSEVVAMLCIQLSSRVCILAGTHGQLAAVFNQLEGKMSSRQSAQRGTLRVSLTCQNKMDTWSAMHVGHMRAALLAAYSM